MAKSKASKSAS